jgi:hypothetical protein
VTLASTFASSLGLSLHQQRIGFALGVALILPGVILFFRQSRTQSPTPPAVSVTSNDQKGGITAHTVNVSVPQTQVGVQEEWHNRLTTDGEYATLVQIDLKDANASHSLYIQATAASLLRIVIDVPGDRGHSREQPIAAEPGVAFITISHPGEHYPVLIFTAKPENIELVVEPNGRHPTPPATTDHVMSIWG